MIMDYSRGPYRSQMRLYPDHPEILTWGQWSYTQPGARFLPIPHAFGSSKLRPDAIDDHPLIGEVRASCSPARKPYKSPYPGLGFVGDPSLFANGSPLILRGSLPVGPDGTCAACGVTRDDVQGGIRAGGNCWERVVQLDGNTGGLAVGGVVGDIGSSSDGATVGGVLVGGVIADTSTGQDTPTGGVAAGGSVPDVSGGYEQPYGGLAVGGVVCDMCIGTVTVSQQITGGGSTDTVNVGHANSGVGAATYGDASHVAVITVDAQGHATAAAGTAIAIDAAAVSGLATVATSGSASDLSAGTLPDARFPGGGFNGASELVELTAAGKMPVLDGSALTSLTAANLTGALPAISGAALTGITASQVAGAATSSSGSATPTTTSVFVAVFDAAVTTGLHGNFVIHNTHATFALTYKLTLTDVFGNAGFISASVGGSTYTTVQIDSITPAGISGATHGPPWKEAKLEIQDQSAGSHATTDIRWSFVG